MLEDLLTNKEYNKILQQKFETTDVVFKNAKWVPISDNVEGFVGDHYGLQINYIRNKTEGTAHFFVKTQPTKTKLQEEIASKADAYKKEIFFYDFLKKEFEKLGYDTSFAPKVYYCKKYETIVMEDLKLRDFKLFGRYDSYDLAHSKLALKALAYYHANSIAYEETKSKELGLIYRINQNRPEISSEIFFVPNDENSLGTRFIRRSIDCFIQCTKLMPEPEEWKTVFKNKLNNLDCAEIFWKPLPFRQTCTHGDLWSNNMLFKYSNGVPDQCCLVDFQLIRHHHPGFDIMLVLYSNTRREFRKKHFNELFDYYYDTFESILREYGFNANDILPKEHVLMSAKSLEVVALFQGAAARTMTQLPTEVMNAAVNSKGKDLDEIMFEEERTRLVLEGCSKNEEFKNIVIDDLYDLYENL